MMKRNFPDNLVEVVLGHPNTMLNRMELAIGVSFAIETLGNRLGEIIRLRYFTGYSVLSLGRMMRLPKSEIERLEQVAINMLKKPSRKIYFEKGIAARLGKKKYSDEYVSGFVRGYLQRIDDQTKPITNPMSRIEINNPNANIRSDIQELSLNEHAEDWLRNNCVNTIEECIELPYRLIVNFENADPEVFKEVADKVNAYGILYSDWDDFL